jgi:hypothetical protein
VLDAERATAGARRNLRRFSFPFELERDIAAVAFAINEHADLRLKQAAPAISLAAFYQYRLFESQS